MTNKDKSKLKNSLRSTVRQSFSRSEHYKAFVDSKRIEWFKGKRKRVSFQCNHCKENFSKSDIDIDHVVPIGKGVYNSISDLERFISLVYCSHDNLQVLCKQCHKVKTKKEQQTPSYHNALF